MPDAIANYSVNGINYFITANEVTLENMVIMLT
jgi:hypothetical protein